MRTPRHRSPLSRAVAAATPLVTVAAAAALAVNPAAASPPSHLDNPFLGGKGYVNREWKERADQTPGGSQVSNNPTSIWLDDVTTAIGATNERMGLRGHLDAALGQGASYVQIVINDLPGKDCDRDWYASDNYKIGEVSRYQREFVDQIAAIESDPKYRSLRLVNIVEPRWAQNLVLKTGDRYDSTGECDAVKRSGDYVTGVRYALAKLRRAGQNVYTYLDAGVYYELGWDDNFDPMVQLVADTVRGTPDGFASVDGFVTNIAGYAPLTEPYLKVDDETKKTKWIDWNNHVDELPYAARVREAMIKAGFGSSIGMVIDTSRNGWGGADRPTKASASSDPDERVNRSRVDRRHEVANWCNQPRAGLGERPASAPRAGIDAYAWIKTPGESDGASTRPPTGSSPSGFDEMCDPKYDRGRGGRSHLSGAAPGAPSRRQWFAAAFAELLQNAYPPLP